MKKRILSLITILSLCVGMLPGFSVQAEGKTFYVSDESGSDSNSGTENAPVKTLNKALELVDGEEATIYVLDNVMVEDTNNDDSPWVIDEKVTIKGDATALPSITVRAGGVILGADVTFQDLQIGVAGFLRPGIAANGHKLELINVHQDSSLRELQIYGGTFFDAADMAVDYGESIRGTASEIVILGGSYEAVYAGSGNASVDLPVSISVAKGNGLTLGGIYVGSTYKNPADTSTAGMIPVLDRSINISGAVDITVNENAPVTIVDGVAESHNVSLTVSGVGRSSFVVNGLDSVTVTNGTFVPAEGSRFGAATANLPNVTLVGSHANKATLDLSEGCDGYDTITVGDFTGSANGILVLPKECSLTVEGTLMGGPTEFRLGGGMPWSDAENPGYSGWMEYETTYINGAMGDGTFVISNPYPSQTDLAFTADSSAENGWTTVVGSLFEPPQLVDFVPVSQVVTYEDANTAIGGYGSVNIEVTTTYTEDELLTDLCFVPLDYQITYTDVNGNIIDYSQQSSAYDSDTDYYWCNYTISTDTAASEAILMKLEPAGESINVCKGDADLAAGTYEIAITATTTTGIVTKSCTLTVLSDGQAIPETTVTSFDAQLGEVCYNDSVLLTAAVAAENNTGSVESGELQLYINDIAYGEAVELTDGSASWETISVLPKNGFQIGNNIIMAVYLGAEGFASSYATMEVTVVKADSSLVYSGESYVENVNYDGKDHGFTQADGTISVQDGKGNTLIENPILGEDYIVLYTTQGEEGAVTNHKVPNLSGEYTVWLQAVGNEYWEESESVSVGTIRISTVEPEITLSYRDFTYRQTEDVVTVSGAVTIEVSGVSEGLVPDGTVTVSGRKGTDAAGIGEADVTLEEGKAIIDFAGMEKEWLEYLYAEYTPAQGAPYAKASDSLYTNYVQVTEEEGTNYTINGIDNHMLYFAPGQSVTVAVEEREGYSFTGWEFQETDGYVIPEVADRSISPISFTMPNGKVSMTATWQQKEHSETCPGAAFADVDVTQWYHGAVDFVLEKKLMSGYANGNFGPNDNLARAQLTQILYSLAGKPEITETMDFPDVSEAEWYADAVKWAASEGIVSGYGNGNFGPNDPITREQLAVMLWHYVGSPEAVDKELEYNDVSEISDWAMEAMCWAVENGVISGKGNGILDPKGQAHRSHVAQMMKNFLEKESEANNSTNVQVLWYDI